MLLPNGWMGGDNLPGSASLEEEEEVKIRPHRWRGEEEEEMEDLDKPRH